MYHDGLKIQQGCKILWEGTIREVSFELSYVLGVDDDWHDAELRGNAITKQMIQDWLEEMSAQGRIEHIDPLTFIQTFENGAVPETFYWVRRADTLGGYGLVPPDLIWEKSVAFKDRKGLATETQPRKVAPAQDCLIHKAVPLVFDGTASQERAVRILRAYEEPYTFIHQENGNWTCLSKDKSYQLYVDMQKHLGYCSCQDFQQRGMQSGMPCKHIYGYVLQDGRIKERTKEVRI